MVREGWRELGIRMIRRTLGISLALYVFYLIAPVFWNIPPLSTRDVLAILAVVFLGVVLGVSFSTAWPLPERTGLPRVFRTIVLTIPALGIGIAIHVTIEGAQGSRAYYIMFALAAWLASDFIRENDDPSTSESHDSDGDGFDSADA